MKSVLSLALGLWLRVVRVRADPLFTIGAMVLLLVILSPSPVSSSDVITAAIQTPGDLAYVAVANKNYLALVDTTAHIVVGTIDLAPAGCDWPWRLAIPPDDGTVWVACRDSDNLVVIDRSSNGIVATVSGFLSSPDGLSFTHDGAYALVGSRVNSWVTVVDTTSYFQIPIYTPGPPSSIAVHPHLPFAYATNRSATLISIIDTVELSVKDHIDIGTTSHFAVVSHDGQRLYTANPGDYSVSAIDTVTNQEIAHITGLGGKPHSLDISPDGDELFVNTGWAGTVAVIDTSLNAVQRTIFVDPTGNFDFPWGSDLTCDGQHLFVTNSKDAWNLNGRQVAVIDTATSSTLALLSTPDSDGDGYPDWGARGIAICPQDVATGVFLSPLPSPKSGARGQVVTHDGMLFNLVEATDSFSLTLGSHVWDTTLSPKSLGPVDHSDSLTFTLHVTVPVDAEWYLTDTVGITATSVASPTDYLDFTIFTTRAYAPPSCTISPVTLTSTQYLNELVTRTLAISNGNGVTLTFAITNSNLLISNEEGHEIPGEQHLSFDATHDIYDYYWGDGGNDAFDGFGYPAVGIGSMWHQVLMEEGVHSYAIAGYPIVVRNDFPVQNVYRMIIEPGPGAGERSDIFVNMGGNMGSDFTTVTFEDSFDFAGRSIRYFVNNDWLGNTGGDPQVVFLLLPSHVEDLADVSYHSFDDTVWFEVTGVSLPVTIYIVVSYHDLPDIEQWFVADLVGMEWPDWLTAEPMTGTIPSDAGQPIEFNFDASGMLFGAHTAQIVLQTNDPFTPTLRIPVVMDVLPKARLYLPLVLRSSD